MNRPALVAPYCGANQQQVIPVPATIVYREVWEEGPWSMKPYEQIFPEVPNDQFPPPPAPAFVPPPLKKTEIWKAQSVWPM